MLYLVALLCLLACAGLIWQMVKRPTCDALHLGVLGLFSIGYYIMPVAFRPLSALADHPDVDVLESLGIHVVFLACLATGCVSARRFTKRSAVLSTPNIDKWLYQYQRHIFWVCYVLYLTFLLQFQQTSYSSDDFNSYFLERNPLLPLLSAISAVLLSIMALAFAAVWASGQLRTSVMMAVAIVSVLGVMISFGQRLILITPLVAVVCALWVTKQHRRALGTLAGVILLLFLVSPFAVFLRQTQVEVRGRDKIFDVGGSFNYGGDVLLTSFQSILDRADVLHNTIYLKHHIDSDHYVGWPFYYSVLISPVPKAILGEKPYILSANGEMSGEISILAWDLMQGGGIGSLTAFGGITAYRQGGWLAIVVDGLMTGALFRFLARGFGEGGFAARILYITMFPMLAVKRVPPSFFESLADLLLLLPFVLTIVVINVRPGASRAVRSTIGQR